MHRYQELHGRPVDPQDVVIIGDTPADVTCGVSIGRQLIG